ncbi:LPXTG-motif cell wall anchor domain-containing protein [Halobacillus alkaliphilus]|uniref:LPXTG-motif cell wall anchor domain-containing protein n=1 Tax=Halobacillus alkaliphilus TaxID=396056 RepID=A0A1I2JX99_9BACI|nr:LPXTG cell wall anchor domain-containing protein [Halobacillus alkaliphilus]SFF58500.1 LPXTG-motif cell wall anchor domain-containing protein [Halobacillus alkaliphilus]
MNSKKIIVSTALTASLALGGTFAAPNVMNTSVVQAETSFDLTQDYADQLSSENTAFDSVVDELGEPDQQDEIEGIQSASWTDGDGDLLTVSTGIDGENVESVVFSEAGDMDFETVDADLAAAFEEIEAGDSYEEVVDIIGAEGTKGASSKAQFEDMSSTASVYTWQTEDLDILSVAFSDGGMGAMTLFSDGETRNFVADGSEVPEEENDDSDNDAEEEPAEEENNDGQEDSADEGSESEEQEDQSGDDSEQEEATESEEENASEEDSGNVTEEEASNDEAADQDGESAEEKEGGELPDTSSSLPLGMLAGLGVALLGAVGLGIRKTKSQ